MDQHYMKVVCSWCGKEIEQISCSAGQEGLVSHSICSACIERRFTGRGFAFLRTDPKPRTAEKKEEDL